MTVDPIACSTSAISTKPPKSGKIVNEVARAHQAAMSSCSFKHNRTGNSNSSKHKRRRLRLPVKRSRCLPACQRKLSSRIFWTAYRTKIMRLMHSCHLQAQEVAQASSRLPQCPESNPRYESLSFVMSNLLSKTQLKRSRLTLPHPMQASLTMMYRFNSLQLHRTRMVVFPR